VDENGDVCRRCGLVIAEGEFHARACKSLTRLAARERRGSDRLTPRHKLTSTLCDTPGTRDQRAHALLALDSAENEDEVLTHWLKNEPDALAAVYPALAKRLQRKAGVYLDTTVNPVTQDSNTSVVLCVEEDVVAALTRGVGTMAVCAEGARLIGEEDEGRSVAWRTCVGSALPCMALAASRCFWRLRYELTTLTLRDARLDCLPSAVLDFAEALTSLDASDNVFTVVPHRFVSAPRLRTLRMARNRVSDFPLDAVATLIALTTLDLSSNRLTRVPDAEIAHRMVELRNVDLSGNALATPPASLLTLPALAQLSIQQNAPPLTAWAAEVRRSSRGRALILS